MTRNPNKVKSKFKNVASDTLTVSNSVSCGNTLTVLGDTDTSSLSTGSIVTNGGLAVSKGIRCGGNINSSGSINSTGNINSTGSVYAGTSSTGFGFGSETTAVQGASMVWNKQNGIGRTTFVNKKGGGTGGFDFYESDSRIFSIEPSGGVFSIFDTNLSGWAFQHIRHNNGTRFNIVNSVNSAYQFCKDGAVISSISASGTYSSSDDRLKENEEYITNGLDTIKKIKPEIYDKRKSMDSTDATTWGKESGVIAQQIWYDAPELRHLVELGDDASPSNSVSIPEDPTQDPDYTALGWGSTTASVNYSGFIPYLISAVQELSRRVETLESDIIHRV